ncbi:MAG TPA: VIT domain-containing protein [Chloroflexota bacterium]|nr:VIT domain-containing protein [Chloroflexota bacterium]
MVRGCPLFGLLLMMSFVLGILAAPEAREAGPATVLASPLAIEAAAASAGSTDPGAPLAARGPRPPGAPRLAQGDSTACGPSTATAAPGCLLPGQPCPPDATGPGCRPPPRPPIAPPSAGVRIESVAVDATVSDGVATTRVTQTFRNSGDRDQEAVYVFPLPGDAAVSDFALWVDGERWEAELLDRDRARQLYESIVRQRRDPALLEYVGRGAFQARIFPVPPGGTRQVTLEYTQALAADAGTTRYSYPLGATASAGDPRAAAPGPGAPLQSLAATVRLRSAQPLRAVYSPTHDVAVQRPSENEAVVSFEAANVVPRGSFDLVYSAGRDAVSATLLSYRRAPEEGTFLLVLAPPQRAEQVAAKDVLLVLDTSGSMQGVKIEQARAALRYVLEHLNADDRFNVISFNSVVDSFAPGLQPMAARPDALAYVDGLRAEGGTNIHEALLTALRQAEPERPTLLVFLTDGLPTNGVTDINRIIRDVGNAVTPNVRLFAFGVGYDVNTVLLDRLARENHGTSDYVKPEENLEERLSAFYTKVASPVLTDLRLDLGRPTHDLYPDPLPDLFAGQQLLVVGRYASGGPTTVTLEGTIDGRRERLTFDDLTLVDDDRRQSYLPGLWATRRIGYLLDQLRLLGTNRALVDEVVQLSTRYGIVTPYTSFFVNEQVDPTSQAGQRAAAEAVQRNLAAAPATGAAGVAASDAARALQQAPVAAPSPPLLPPPPAAPTGTVAGGAPLGFTPPGAGAAGTAQPAVNVADRLQRVGDRAFVLRDGVWTDTTYSAGQETRRVAFGSDAYFALLAERPELAAYFAVGERVIVVLDGQAYEVLSAEQ